MISADSDLLNADWLRASRWSVLTPDGSPVMTVPQLCRAIGAQAGNSRQALADFLKLPAAQPMPPVLRSQVMRITGGTALAADGDAVELSAQTAALEATPSPWGSPAGPGLWRHKGWKLPIMSSRCPRAS